jgi:hypothetical protein
MIILIQVNRVFLPQEMFPIIVIVKQLLLLAQGAWQHWMHNPF